MKKYHEAYTLRSKEVIFLGIDFIEDKCNIDNGDMKRELIC